jgi:hypothetical protein
VVKAGKSVKLKGVLEGTASSAEIKSDGSLVVELYDFSDEAEKWLGNDVAFLLKVSSDDKGRLLSCLMAGQNQMVGSLDRDELLLRLLQERFADYYAVKQWLEENRIPYQKEFDPWA